MKAINSMPMDEVEDGKFLGESDTALLDNKFETTFACSKGFDKDDEEIEDLNDLSVNSDDEEENEFD